MKILKAAEMKEIDQKASSEYGIPSLLLMENAGARVVEFIKQSIFDPVNRRIIIVAGKGNNGGDGLVVARHLLNLGAEPYVFLLAEEQELPPDARLNFKIFRKMSGKIYPLLAEEDLVELDRSLAKADLIIDAIYGIGFRGPLKSFEARIVSIVNASQKPVVAVDIPTGVEGDSGKVYGEAIRASYTVSFALPKLGLILAGKEYTGEIKIVDISIPRSLLADPKLEHSLITGEMVKGLLPERPAQSHKGTFGHALVVGGSMGLSGAVMMTAQAALRCGAGLVTAAVPESLAPVVESRLLEVMTVPLAQTNQSAISLEALPAIGNLLGTSSVCAIGPGLSTYSEANAIVRFVLERSGIPVVVDADGLNALQGDVGILKNRQVPIVLTPHPGEMARLTGKSIDQIQANRIEIARNYAQDWQINLVLKGSNTVVATPAGEVYINNTGNPGMATAGSGDVLCGIITGLIAQGLKARDAALAGVYIHGLSGDRASKIKGQRGMIASDIIRFLPAILKSLEKSQTVSLKDSY
ncbi:MAG: NAD(P)H-hydrate dehydratase [Syntrophomonadaceae bacterium]